MGLLVILWNIIKVIGFIVLVVFLLLVLMMLLILFSPICYQIAGNDRECINGKFDVRWILGAIHAYGDYGKEGLRFSLRLFGLCIYGADKKQKKKKEKQKKEEYTQEDVMLSARSKEQDIAEQKQEEKTEKVVEEKIEKETIQKTEQEVEQEQKIEQTAQQHSRQKLSGIEDIEKENKENKKESKKEKKQKKRAKKVVKSKKTKQKRVKRDKKENKKKEKLKFYANYFWNMEDKKELVQGIVTFCKRMLKGVAPKHCAFKATVGTGDPALTGYVLAAVGALHMKFGKGLQVTGDFTQKVIKDVFLEIKGKIMLGYLLYAVLKLVLLKPVLQTIKVIWKGQGE